MQPLVGILATNLAFATNTLLAPAKHLFVRPMKTMSCTDQGSQNKVKFDRAAAVNMLFTHVWLGCKLRNDSIGRIERMPPICRDT
jgi:hypothetical protein